MRQMNKKGGVVTNTVMGVGGLIIGVNIILVITTTLLNANLLDDSSVANATAHDLQANFTTGIDNISEKIPTILLIIAVVFLFGALVLLVQQSRLMGVGGGSSL